MFRMLEDDRRRAGWSVGQAAWRLGVSIRKYRELEAGERSRTFETWDRICKSFHWSIDVHDRARRLADLGRSSLGGERSCLTGPGSSLQF
jgi:hypothetical protein